jgi:UDP-N-acetylmuramoyl-L-alanyl-D-glutamate--2,6-diaminopimelate ligase
MVDEGVKYCFMEVSSHAIHQNRIAGLDFDIACFTNITHDHLDYHNTFDEYIAAKKLFFDYLSPNAIALVNADDKHGQTMLLNCKAKHLSFGIKNMADYKGKVLENQFEGLMMMIDGKEVWTKLIGSFNASNLILVYGVARELGQDVLSALTAISTLESVNGRFQYYRENNITGIVDYAHTPDALKNVLSTIADIRTGNETLYTIVGCGGDRDAAKRPMMAKIAAENSDKVILTSDNPRSEEPQAIIDDMKTGITPDQTTKVLSITDRKEAIRTACMLAKANDIILIAGKGHETYQEINGVKHDFNDKEVLQESLKLITG